MTDCKQRYEELTHVRDVVLDEDLAALQKTTERERIERYNEIKRHEEELRYEFGADCPDFLTDAEQDRARSGFRLARLLIAASFYADGDVPRALEGDFVEAELQAVVDFDRYKAFDALDEEGIQRRIRRMEGEVYDLVREYHSTQLANVDELLDDPSVHQDVMERLLERYEDRFEKVRQGFYTYVETHGLEHVVETVEEAVRTVADAERERAAVREGLQESPEPTAPDEAGATLEELADRIEELGALESRLDGKMAELEAVRDDVREDAREAAREETATVVESELDALREQRDELERELDHLRRERDRLQAAEESSAEGEEAFVGETTARLYEMDYIGRFDTSVHEADVIHTPDGEFAVPEGYWDARSEHRSELVPGEDEQYPINSRARYEITDSGYLGLSRDLEMVIEAAVYSHLEAHERDGHDAAPADLEDLLSVVDEVVYEAEAGDYHHLIAIASPTGWAQQVREQMRAADHARTRFSRNVSVCLVDLQDGEVIYDPTDEIARANAELFELSVDAERVRECKQFVREEYAASIEHDSVLLEDVVEQGFDVHVVRQAFDELESAGVGEQLYLDELGNSLVLEN